MKKLITLLVVALLVAVMVTPVMALSELPCTVDLIADGRGSALDVGDLTVAADGVITFTIDTASTDWLLDETHLYVGDVAPARSSPGKFEFKTEDLGGVATDNYSVDLAAADLNGDGIVYIAAHAALVRTVQIGVDELTGEPIYGLETESAWAQGDESIGSGNNWATCFTVALPVIPLD